jgi:hypothetical protein
MAAVWQFCVRERIDRRDDRDIGHRKRVAGGQRGPSGQASDARVHAKVGERFGDLGAAWAATRQAQVFAADG